jgi:hypothetical protein
MSLMILVVGEDELCCVLGSRLVAACLPEWRLAQEPINKRGVTKLAAAIPRYVEYARHVHPVLCIADTDGVCPATMSAAWQSGAKSDALLLRLAVTEAESWVLADADTLAKALAISPSIVPREPDGLRDAKAAVVALARRSAKRSVRDDFTSPFDRAKPGSGYVTAMCEVVRTQWRAAVAADRSPSLRRAMQRLVELGARHS